MNSKDPLFKELNGTIQVRSREVREAGVAVMVKRAAVIYKEEEHVLWESMVIATIIF